jgi:hypothetical protein
MFFLKFSKICPENFWKFPWMRKRYQIYSCIFFILSYASDAWTFTFCIHCSFFGFLNIARGAHCKKSVLKIQEYIHEGANLKFYIPEFFNFKLLIPEYSPIYRFWFQTAAYFSYSDWTDWQKYLVTLIL